MKMNRWINIILWITLLPMMLFSQSTDSLVNLSDLLKEGIENNPDLKSAYNNWQADQAKIPQAGSLPDPQVSINLLNLPVSNFEFDREPMTGKQIALMQMFPFPGKLGLRTDIAEAGAQVSQAKYDELQNQLKKMIALTYYDIFFVDKSIETVKKNQAILRDFTRVAESRYTVGKGIQQDVLKAQVELSKMEDRLITLDRKRQALTARMNALLNRDAGTPFGTPVVRDVDTLSVDLSRLKNLADENRPLLQAWQTMIRQSEKKVKLAKKDYLPDFKVGIAYTQREELESGMGGADFVSGLFTIDVPLYFWRKQRKKVEETRYSEQMIRNKFLNVRNQVYSDLDKNLSDLEKNLRLVELYESGIIPQATQSLNSAVAGYQNDKVDFLTLLNNEMSLFNFELDYYRFLTDYSKARTELEAAVGFELNQE